MSKTRICVAGVHTDAGKTCVSAVLCATFGLKYFKLIQAGSPSDSSRVKSFAKSINKPIKTLKEGLFLPHACSPSEAMKKEGIKTNALKIPLPRKKRLLVELAGGLFTPLDDRHFMIDYVKKHDLSVFLVLRDYLGVINHTALSLQALKHAKIKLLAIIISGQINQFTLEFLKNRYKNLRFFVLDELGDDPKKAAKKLKKQIKKSEVIK